MLASEDRAATIRVAADGSIERGIEVATAVHQEHVDAEERQRPGRAPALVGDGSAASDVARRAVEVTADTDFPAVLAACAAPAPGRVGIFDILFDWIHDGRRVCVIGDGRNRFQFVHALDLLDAYFIAVQERTSGTYNVGTDRFGTLGEALDRLIAHAGSGSGVRHLPVGPAIGLLRLLDACRLSPLAPWHYRTYHKPFYFDVQPLLDAGWKPRYSNDEMLRECYDWFVAHRADREAVRAGSPHRRAVKQRALALLKKLS